MPKRVLIADDTDFYRSVLYDILSKGGYEVVGQAVNGAEALAMAAQLRPEIVILDIIMPVKNGIEAAREISRLKEPPKIVMCTSLGYEPIVDEAIRSGACAYIVKPLSGEKVLKTLRCI
ncbi:MAG: response regulator [Thermodesulfobacteriota bacterium]